MPIVIERLGSSTCVTGSGRGSSGSASVSLDRHLDQPGDGEALLKTGRATGPVPLRRERSLATAAYACHTR
jgi:hypothetical protein